MKENKKRKGEYAAHTFFQFIISAILHFIGNFFQIFYKTKGFQERGY